MIWFSAGAIIGGLVVLLAAHERRESNRWRFFKYGWVDGCTEGYITGLQDHAELIRVLREVYEASEYWSDYDVPITLKDDIKRAIDNVTSKIGEVQ